jgi:hypothetical protein
MARILPAVGCKNPQTDSTVLSFFRRFELNRILDICGIRKKKGLPSWDIVLCLISMVFTNKSISALDKEENLPCGKSSLFRFLDNPRYCWRKVVLLFSLKILFTFVKPAAGKENRLFEVLIVDDTLYPRNRSKKVELLSRRHDHNSNQYVKGFDLLTVGYSDGISFIPMAFSLQSSQKENVRLQEASPDIDKRTYGGKLRSEAIQGKPKVLLSLLSEISKAGVKTRHILFDSWFGSNRLISDLMGEGYLPICMVKDWKGMKFHLDGESFTLSQLYSKAKWRLDHKSRDVMGSVLVSLGNDSNGNVCHGHVIFVRNRNKGKREWLAILNTDPRLTEREAVRIYGKRWDIEVFFKVCKSVLKLARELQVRSFDSLVAHTSIVFLRYMLLSCENRLCQDERSHGELFAALCDELEDISLKQAIDLLFAYLEIAAREEALTPERLKVLQESFMADLAQSIKYFQVNKLQIHLAA